jgi:biopolymer transport protein ExbD
MAIKVPGKRYGKRFEHSKVFGHGGSAHKKQTFADLLITPLVDMFVIIVLFLIANFSATGEIMAMSKDVQLPTAAHVKEIELVPIIMIARDSNTQQTKVIVEGQPILENAADMERADYLNIPALEDRLRELKKTFEAMHANSDHQEFNGDVNIQSDKNVPFKVIKRVMFSCAAAGYGNVNFAVLNGGSGDTATGTKTASADKPAP